MLMVNQNIDKLTAEELFSQKIYWLNKLSGELPETSLITDYVRPTDADNHKSIQFEFSCAISTAIIKLAKSSYFSIYLLLLSVLAILMQKYTSNNDVILGSPIYNPEISYEDLTNKQFPLRFNVRNQLTFKDFLLHVKDITIGAYSHQDFSFDELVRLLNIPYSQNPYPLFDILVILENIHNQSLTEDLGNDLTFSFRVNENLIQGKINYKGCLFREETIKAIIKHYVNILECVFTNVETIISDICLLKEDEQHQLLKGFNDNAKLYPINQTIDNLFEQQVAKTPEKIAVVANTKLTYQELNKKANQLARFIQNLGVKKGDFIGILKQRDINFLIAIIAILKVGAVYVPIDSTYPESRIRYMVSNSELRLLLTDSGCPYTNLLKDWTQLKHLIFLDIKSDQQGLLQSADIKIYNHLDFDKLPTENLELNHTGVDPAYMIYTSGSTGSPKGAIIRHGGAINHIYAQFDALELTEELTFLQSAPASSDISVWQFLAPILIGGKTIIVDTETVCSPRELFQVIQTKNITIVELVPVVLTGLLDYVASLSPEQRLLPNLKWMMVTGESASVELVNRWLQVYPAIKVVNAYGPTEAADDITQFIIDKPLPENQRTIPIGKPLANLILYILDSQMQLVPIGVPGEICVSGFGVGLGYWKNERKTNLSFVPNPFACTAKPLPGTNTDFIYKTGDLGRWLADGNIEFLGRIDNQVKIRGFRIELGEIEAKLSQHLQVQEAVVVVREDNPGDKRLVGYVVPTEYQASSSKLVSQLRQFLQEKLPEYMIPSALVLIESLPLTPNGKVDRQALPAPDTFKSDLEAGFVASRTVTEAIVADIWAEILGLKQVGIHNNFFDLGGHSLLATQVISRLQEAFEVKLSLRSLFEEPTVAKLAEHIDRIRTLQQLQTPAVDNTGDREEIEL